MHNYESIHRYTVRMGYGTQCQQKFYKYPSQPFIRKVPCCFLFYLTLYTHFVSVLHKSKHNKFAEV